MSNLRNWPGEHVVEVICAKESDPGRVKVPDSERVHCYNCNAAIMLSPATKVNTVQNFGTNYLTVCMDCAVEYSRIRRPARHPDSSDQVAEIMVARDQSLSEQLRDT